MNLDRTVAAAVVVIYGVTVVALLPATQFAHMLGGGLVFFGGVAAVARLRGNAPSHPHSVFAVSVVGVAILLMPNFSAMGGQHPIGVPIGFLGSQAAALLWMALRWEAGSRSETRTALPVVLLVGLSGAVVLSLIASIPIGIGLLSGDGDFQKAAPWIYAAYFGGGLSAAFIYWMLQGIGHRPVGLYLIGALGGFCLYSAVGPVVSILDGEPIGIGEIAAMGLVLGCLVGPPVAMSWSDTFTS